MLRRVLILVLIVCFLLPFTSGCCYFKAKKQMANAESALAELKAKGGATKVPYEYCSAESFLNISKMEFAENDFKAAERFAIRSKSASQAGITEAQKK